MLKLERLDPPFLDVTYFMNSVYIEEPSLIHRQMHASHAETGKARHSIYMFYTDIDSPPGGWSKYILYIIYIYRICTNACFILSSLVGPQEPEKPKTSLKKKAF